jgi:TPR repeat protein
VKLSADQGNADAQNMYGTHLETGSGVPQNATKATEYYKLSADQGNLLGQYNYG